jgi:tRNA(Ile)-lysidine synthase
MSRRDLAVEQQVLRGIKHLSKRPQRILLALSGGADSMVMAEILYKWRKGLQLELSVAHVHHGPAKSRGQAAYRRRARALVKAWASERNLQFFTNEKAPLLTNENEMREWRELHLARWMTETNAETVAFAHHQDDLLETRLIRLVRGAGAQGLHAMGVYQRRKFRPLLALSGVSIREYARESNLKWVEDPSNAKVNILRNWMRHEWLPSLERQRPGAVRTLARSLATVTAMPVRELDLAPYVGLRRKLLSRELLAQYLKALGLKNYAQTHVDEILKRVSSRRKNLEFDMLGMRFQVSSDFLWASRV